MGCCGGQCGAGVLTRVAALVGIGMFIGAVHSMGVKLVGPLEEPAKPASGGGEPAKAPVVSATPAAADPGASPGPLGLRITVADAKQLFEDGVPFIDARPDHEYVLGTIPGSFHITPATFSSEATTKVLVFLDQSKPLVIFCSGGDCHDSENLAALMKDAGYTRLHILTEGYPAWQSAGYETAVPEPAGGS